MRTTPARPPDVLEVGCRILFLAPQLGVGGLERQLVELMKSMDRERYRPCVAVWNYDESERHVAEMRALGVPVLDLGESSAWGKLRALRQLVAETKPQILHSFSFYTNAAAAFASWRQAVLAVGSIRCDFDYEKRHSGTVVGRLSARWPRRQVCNSWLAADNVRRAKGPFVPERVQVVSNGVDVDAFSPSPRGKPGPVAVVGLGTLCRRKNWAALLPIIARWADEDIDVIVRIAGEGPLREDLQSSIQARGLEGRVELVGEIRNVPQFFEEADIVVHVSTSEGTPNVVLEAMAAGRPVVAFDSGDMRRLIDDDLTGYVVPGGAIDALESRLRRLIEDQLARETMGQAGRRKAETQFRLADYADRMLGAYARLAERDEGSDEPQTPHRAGEERG